VLHLYGGKTFIAIRPTKHNLEINILALASHYLPVDYTAIFAKNS